MDRPEIKRANTLMRRALKERDAALWKLRLELSNIDAQEKLEIVAAQHRAEIRRRKAIEQIALLEDPGPCS